MKKTILNLGRQLTKKEQINIVGGSEITHECDPAIHNECCYYQINWIDCDTGNPVMPDTENSAICQVKEKVCQPF